MSIRWMIAMISLFLLNTLISNIIEGQDLYTQAQVSQIQSMRETQISESKDASGGLSVAGLTPFSVVQAIYKSLTLDYSFLHDVRYDLTQVQCATISNATWDTATSTCQYPNVWYYPYLILLWGPLVSVGFYIVVTLIHGQ